MTLIMMMMTTITTLLQARSHIFLFFLYFYTTPSNYTLLNTSFLPSSFFFLGKIVEQFIFPLFLFLFLCEVWHVVLSYLPTQIHFSSKKIYRHRRHQDNTLVLIYFILEATSTFSCTHDHQKGSMDTFPCHHHHRKNRKRKVKVGSNRASCVTSYHFSHAQKICVNMHIGK